ncbi:MAG: hypothetical protein C0390_11670 [Syntrophus sp. (in: bacteria)]|nr:hypothetical protein [Syntrophus sp. (in: bacteria)]
MKIFATVSVKGVSSRAIRQPRRVQCKIASRRNLLRRFERFIESTDWDERYLRSKWIDKVCIGVFFISMLYFVPVFAPIFLR